MAAQEPCLEEILRPGTTVRVALGRDEQPGTWQAVIAGVTEHGDDFVIAVEKDPDAG